MNASALSLRSVVAAVAMVMLLVPMLAYGHDHDHEIIEFQVSIVSGDEVISEPTVRVVDKRAMELSSVTESGEDSQHQELRAEFIPALDGDDILVTGSVETSTEGRQAQLIEVAQNVVSGESFVVEFDDRDVRLEVQVQVVGH